MGCLAEKGRNLITLRALRKTEDPQRAQKVIAGALPPLIGSILQPDDFQAISQRLRQLPEPPPTARLSGTDWFGALGVFLIVFLSTFPVALPFVFMQNVARAMRIQTSLRLSCFSISLGIWHLHGYSRWSACRTHDRAWRLNHARSSQDSGRQFPFWPVARKFCPRSESIRLLLAGIVIDLDLTAQLAESLRSRLSRQPWRIERLLGGFAARGERENGLTRV